MSDDPDPDPSTPATGVDEVLRRVEQSAGGRFGLEDAVAAIERERAERTDKLLRSIEIRPDDE